MSEVAAKKFWTILDLINWGTTYLSEKGFTDSRLSIELLLAHVLNLQRIQLYTNFDKPLSEDELATFKELFKRRLNHEPLQYLIGKTEFMGLEFSVDERVLIPRPDTEVLVEKVLELSKIMFSNEPEIKIFEIGSGSGCIAISLAKMIPTAKIISIDVSANALNVAKANAEKNGVSDQILFEEKDVFQRVGRLTPDQCHLIVSNPPYISLQEYDELPADISKYEPRLALADEGDGLKFYHEIAKIANDILCENGVIVVEHAYNQSEEVQKIFQVNGWPNTESIKDYSGNNRCVVARKI